jgi:hypothetical protein
MINWEYTFYISSITDVGIKEMSAIGALWDDNGYRLWNSPSRARSAQEVDIVNRFGQKGWELVSITPISFLINGNEIGMTKELMFTFKKQLNEQ